MTDIQGEAPTVLVVDDDLDHLIIVRRVLARLAPRFRVTTIVDSRDLMPRVLAAPHGALLLIDCRLGDADGLALLAEACRARPDLRAALLSAALTRSEQRRALACGARIAAEKPAALEGWRTLLETLLDAPGELARAA